MRLHVKFSDGSDGLPVGHPTECIESESDTLLPGYAEILTQEELSVRLAQFLNERNTFYTTRAADAETALKRDRVVRLFEEPGGRALTRKIFQLENLVRQLVRALRSTSAAANTAASSATLPTAAQAADVTQAQFLIDLEGRDA